MSLYTPDQRKRVLGGPTPDTTLRGNGVWEFNRRNTQHLLPFTVTGTPPTITRTGVAASGTGTLVPWTSPVFRYGGGLAEVAGVAYPDSGFGLIKRGAGQGSIGAGQVSFRYYGQSLEFYAKEFAGTGFIVKANGQWLTTTLQTLTQTAPGSLIYHKIDFGSVALREVELHFNGQFYFGGIVPENGNRTCYAPVSPVPRRCVVLGDSYTQGSLANSYLTGFARVVGEVMGWDVWASGIGGTGYTVAPTIRSRLATDLYPAAPDYVVLAAGHNDTGSTGTVQAEVEQIIDGIRTNLPAAKIFVVGPLYERGYAGSGPIFDIRAALLAACASRGLTLIDAYGESWVTGQKTVTAGNSADFISGDNVHPSEAGHSYIGQRLAAAIIGQLN